MSLDRGDTYPSSDYWEPIEATIAWHRATANNCLYLNNITIIEAIRPIH